MNYKFLQVIFLMAIIFSFAVKNEAQNRNFITSVSYGFGNSGFKTNNQTDDELSRLNYLMGGIQIQKRINSKWAISFFPNVGNSGNKRKLNIPIGNITEVRSTSAFVNLSVHPKFFLNKSVYFSLGPEISYLIWNYGSTYSGEIRQSNRNETKFFNRTNLLVSSSIGFSKKVTESRKNAPIQIDGLWYLELRAKKGITNIIKEGFFDENISTTISSFEIVTGFSFASKN